MGVADVTSLVLAVLGTAGTVFFGVRSLRLSRELGLQRTSLSWEEVHRGAIKIFTDADRFRPEIVLMISNEGAIVTGIALAALDRAIPTYLAMLERRGSREFAEDFTLKHHKRISTPKWLVHVPLQITEYRDRRLLLVDDRVITGTVLSEVRTFLLGEGFPESNIQTAALVCGKAAQISDRAPNHVYRWISHDTVEFPYGTWDR